MTISPRTGRFSAQRSFDYRRLVGVFDVYALTGQVDLSCPKRGGGGPRPVSSEFIALAGAWDASMADRDLALATRDAYGGRTSRSRVETRCWVRVEVAVGAGCGAATT